MEKNAPRKNSSTRICFSFSSSQSTRKENPIKFAAQHKRSIIYKLTHPKRPRLHPVIQTFQIRFLFVLRGKKRVKNWFSSTNTKEKKKHEKRKTKQDKKKREKKTCFCVWCQSLAACCFFFPFSIFFHHFCRTRSARGPYGRVCACLNEFFFVFLWARNLALLPHLLQSRRQTRTHTHTTSRRCLLHATSTHTYS